MLACLTHQPQIKCQVVDGQDLKTQHLLGMDQVTHISTGVLRVYIGRSFGIERGKVVLPLLVAHIHNPVAGENHTIATVTSRHDAVEHIDSALDAFQYIPRRADAHQIAGLVLGQNGIDDLDHLVHLLRRLAHRQTTNSIAVTVKITQTLRRLLAQIGIDAPLHDGEEVLLVSVQVLRAVETGDAAVQPTVGAVHRLRGVLAVCRARTALVERHHDIGTDKTLGIHHGLWGKEQFAAINMARETHALFRHLADVGQREDLVTARIGQNGACPTLKLMQTARLIENISARTQEKMVSVAQNNLRMNIIHKVATMHALDRAYRADRHENRGQDVTVVGMNNACTSG